MVLRSVLSWLSSRCEGRFAIGAYTCLTVGLTLITVWLGWHLSTAFISNLPPAPAIGHTRGSVVLTQDAWHEQIRTPSFWRERGNSSGSQNRNGIGLLGLVPTGKPDPLTEAPRSERSSGELFRTVCVRLCDGSFKPISFSTTRQHFGKDQARCENSCGSPSRLFVYDARSGSPEHMVDVNGTPYAELPTANLFRTKYDDACKCRAHPWEEASLAQHKVYALEAKTTKTKDATVAALVTEQRQKIDAASRALKTEQATLTATKFKSSGTPTKPRISQVNDANTARERASARSSRTTLDSADLGLKPAKPTPAVITNTAARASPSAAQASWRQTAFRGN